MCIYVGSCIIFFPLDIDGSAGAREETEEQLQAILRQILRGHEEINNARARADRAEVLEEHEPAPAAMQLEGVLGAGQVEEGHVQAAEEPAAAWNYALEVRQDGRANVAADEPREPQDDEDVGHQDISQVPSGALAA